MDAHPAFQPQAVADREAIANYHKQYKKYTDIWDDINKEWWVITKEMEIFEMSDDEFNKLSEKEKSQLAKKFVSLNQQKTKNREKLAAHEKTKPIRPDDAFKRTSELEKTMPRIIDVNTGLGQ